MVVLAAGIVVVLGVLVGTTVWGVTSASTAAFVPVSGAMLWGWYAWRYGWQVEVDGNTVTWRSLLQQRQLRLDQLMGNDTVWFASSYQCLLVRDEPRLLMMASGKGWMAFLEALNERRPDRPFRPTSSDRLSSRFPGAGWFGSFYEREA
jgi:hypothetical protein